MKYLTHIAFVGFLLFFFSSTAYGDTHVRPFDTLYVWAESGLNVRDTPSTDGKKLGKLDYGEQIVALDWGSGQELTITAIKSQYIQSMKLAALSYTGRWIPIDFEGQKGYVFDGFLSKLPTIKIAPDQHQADIYRATESLEEYAARTFGMLKKLSVIDTVYPIPSKPRELLDRNNPSRIIYKNGAILNNYMGEGYGGQELIVPNLSFREGFLLFAFLNPEIKILDKYPAQLQTNVGFIGGEIQKDVIRLEFENYTAALKKVSGFVVISGFGTC